MTARTPLARRFARRIGAYRGSARTRLAAVAGLVVFAVLAGTSAGWAYWSTALHVTGSATKATLAISTTNFESLNYTFMNNTLTTTGSVTVTNTTVSSSSTAGQVTLGFGQAASSNLGTKVSLTAWPTTNTAGCVPGAAVGANSFTAVWSTGTSTSFALTPGTGKSFCVRSFVTTGTRNSVWAAGGTQSFTPRLTATMTVPGTTWTASATPVTTTEKTQAMYEPTTVDTAGWLWLRPNWGNAQYDYCLDVSDGNTQSGGFVIAYGCKTTGSTNQMFRFVSTGDGFYRINPRHASGLSLDTDGSQAAGTGISTRTTAANSQSQRWQAQDIGNGYIQLMNVDSLLCLSAPNGTGQNNGPLTQAACADAPGQQWTLSRTVENDSASRANNNDAAASISYKWDTIPDGPYVVQLLRNGAWVTIPTTTSTNANGSVTTTTYTAAALYAANGNAAGSNLSIRVIDSFSTRVAIGTVSFTRTTPIFFGSPYYTVSTYTISDLQ